MAVTASVDRVLRVGRATLLYRSRPIVVGLALLLALLVLAVLTLTLGRAGIPIVELLPAVAGNAEGAERFVLTTLRGPRLAVAIAAGGLFGIAGCLFQSVTRNPLGSPDVIGVTAGAGAGAVAFGLLWPGILPLQAGALLGALIAVGAVYSATGRGFSSPTRIIIAGIGVSAMAVAFIEFAITRVGREQAQVIAAYLSGSTAARSWDDVAIGWAALVPIAIAAVLISTRLSLVEMGDDLADALGADAARTKLAAVLLAVVAATAAVSVVGPIAFIALTAPQIARRLTRSIGPGPVVSAISGAAILVFADLIAQQAASDLPVGVVAAAAGGVYLGFLLVSERRKGHL